MSALADTVGELKLDPAPPPPAAVLRAASPPPSSPAADASAPPPPASVLLALRANLVGETGSKRKRLVCSIAPSHVRRLHRVTGLPEGG